MITAASDRAGDMDIWRLKLACHRSNDLGLGRLTILLDAPYQAISKMGTIYELLPIGS
jgi:hypothetical protein